MKKFAVIFVVIFLAFAINAFAVVHDHNTYSANGTYSCDVWAPLTITGPGTVNLGVFVVGQEYTNTDADWGAAKTMDFTITGQAGQTCFCKWLTVSSSTNGTRLNLNKAYGGGEMFTLVAGDNIRTMTCLGVSTVDANPEMGVTFLETLEVSYTAF